MTYTNLLTTLLALACLLPAFGQDREDLMSDVMRTAPGKERATRLVQIAAQERAEGRTRYAIEFAILGSSEAERHALDAEMAAAQLELARAHMSKGDLENAVKACMLVTRLEGAQFAGDRARAELLMASHYLDAGFPQMALEHIQRIATTETFDEHELAQFSLVKTKALAITLPPPGVLQQCDRVLDKVRERGDDRVLLDVLSMRASALTRMGRFQEALESEQEVAKLAQRMNLIPETGVSLNNMGELHQRMGHAPEALVDLERALEVLKDLPKLRARTVINIAHIYALTDDVEAGIRVLDRSIRQARSEGDKDVLPQLLVASAELRQRNGRTTSALEQAHDALNIAEANKAYLDQLMASVLLSNLYGFNGNYKEADRFHLKVSDTEKRIGVEQEQQRLAHEAQLIRAQRAELEQVDRSHRDQNKDSRLKQFALDAENHEKQLALLVYETQLEAAARREALLAKDQANKQLGLTQAALEAERQTRRIKELDSDRMLQALSLARLEAEQLEREKHMELMEERAQVMDAKSRTLAAENMRSRDIKRFSIGIALGTLMVATLLLALWLNTRRKKRTIWMQNQQIKGINDVLAEKDQNIQSSLRYAQTIQSAIVPSEAMLRSILPESFLFYRPLDKVSGDMPFVKQVGDTVYLAAIDCTGHGVPAAMMTFIAYYGLNELIGNDPNAPCGGVLDQLHQHVKRTMEAREGQGLYNDGMDIGLCKIDLRHGRITFSGAQLSLYLVRNGHMVRLKGDVMPLGDDHFQRGTGYREETMDLKPADLIYLFSDGIIHQYGGPDGRKKLSMKRLAESLAGSSHMDLNELKSNTERLFLEWKGDTPQTDDVLMIGMRYAA